MMMAFHWKFAVHLEKLTCVIDHTAHLGEVHVKLRFNTKSCSFMQITMISLHYKVVACIKVQETK